MSSESTYQHRCRFWMLAVGAASLLSVPARAADVPSNGWVVWASNRKDSRHEIYLMKADGSGVTRLTFNGGDFPGWSPDAKWIAYTYPSDSSTHVIRHDGSGDKKVCGGSFEFWMWDGSGLVCRVGDDHYRVNPDTGAKTLLFKKSDFTKVGSKDLNPGGITHDGRYLVAHSDIYRTGFTGDNGTFKAYHAAVILDFQNKGKLYYFGSGCEPNTPPSGDLIYHVCGDCPTYPDPYRMNVNDIATRSSYAAEIAHADADWGHEYFPRISNDNVWMVYGATTGCHDHLTCDYEIWVHRLGAGSSNRTRITTHTANDRWPHLHVGTLPSFGCTTASQCDDGDPCTTDTCSAGKCQHSAISGCCTANSQCDDSDPCTADVCSSNKCQHSSISGCCTSNSECDDSNVCTTDTCSSNKCQHAAISGCCTASSQCDDSDPCTADLCSSNKCQHSSISGCCTSNSDCDDSNVCTTDTCSSNKCQHSPVSGCCASNSDCDDSNPCTTDSCDTASGKCANKAVSGCCAFDTDCDDGNPCTLNKCVSNKCQTSPVPGCCAQDSDCDDANPCTTDSCDTSSGKCSSTTVSDCCVYDTDCDDGDPCTLDSCDPSSHICQQTNICGDAGVDSTPQPDAGVGELGPGNDALAPDGGSGSALEPADTLVGGCSVGGHAAAPWAPLLLIGLFWSRARRKARR